MPTIAEPSEIRSRIGRTSFHHFQSGPQAAVCRADLYLSQALPEASSSGSMGSEVVERRNQRVTGIDTITIRVTTAIDHRYPASRTRKLKVANTLSVLYEAFISTSSALRTRHCILAPVLGGRLLNGGGISPWGRSRKKMTTEIPANTRKATPAKPLRTKMIAAMNERPRVPAISARTPQATNESTPMAVAKDAHATRRRVSLTPSPVRSDAASFQPPSPFQILCASLDEP